MIFDELPIVFPWYPKLENQNRFSELAKKTEVFKLNAPADALLPFQFFKGPGAAPTGWFIYFAETGNLAYNITALLAEVKTVTREGREYWYYGGQQLNLFLSAGYYYSKIDFGPYYSQFSEVFYVHPTLFSCLQTNVCLLKMHWYNDSDLRPIFYNDIQNGKPVFKNTLYLDAIVDGSEPEIIEDTEKDGFDEPIPVFTRMVIRYRIVDLVPDFVKNAIVAMQMHDHKFLTTANGVRGGEMTSMSSNTAPDADSDLNKVEIVFIQTMAMVKKDCADNMV